MRTRRPPSHAVAGAAALLAVAGLAGCTVDDPIDTDQTRRDETGRIAEGGAVGVFALQLGDCSDDPTVPAEAGTAAPVPPGAEAPTTAPATLGTLVDGTPVVDQVPAIPCDMPHDFEVYGLFDVVDEPDYPGESIVVAQAEVGCLQRFEGYVGAAYVADGARAVSYLYPTAETWSEGDRAVHCLVHGPTQRSGSVRGTGA